MVSVSIIKSLNLLSSYETALTFYQSMGKFIKDEHSISQTTYDYWVESLKPNA